MSDRAVVFAGQGAQSVGMGKDLAESSSECAELFKKADEVLGHELSKICFEGPETELTKSNNCQPAIFVTSLACYRALMAKRPDLSFVGTAGLSLGEWTALHVAGVLSFEDTLRVLEARGRYMQDACEERDGSMVSVIGLSMEGLDRICVETGVEKANLNSPAQTVLSGEREAIVRAKELADAAGAKRAIVLNVAGAFHSSLMDPAARRLEEFLAGIEFSEPTMPVVANVRGAPHGEPGEIKEAMVKQVNSSVHWFAGIDWFKAQGVGQYIECGPGKVLSGLIKRIDKEAVTANVQDAGSLERMVNGCLARPPTSLHEVLWAGNATHSVAGGLGEPRTD